ncbi:ribosome biogenesis GTP-binding protein YihA/YsxC [Desulfofalx alkaliphila]|uniref:ribosome biogenesis GTP-binding protein YihA/YsxC n=1 Tax=Desulfofalx alkaliphila TaxID=105483 RepID=UPI0004E21F01|nr:ribosome biogenesis GTP-binding protein YihA/YsxC [Desulfofalx alkaliphila]
MKIVSAGFVTSAVNPKGYPEDQLPEVAFVGRSNVGKSSLLNKLVSRRGLARTSKSPGRTQLINFFLINESFYFVDLPGYGFAKVSMAMKEKWGKMIEAYLRKRQSLRGVVMLVDIRHEPTQQDMQMYSWLCHYNLPVAVALTKADKLSKNLANKQVALIKKKLQLQASHSLVVTSSQTGAGREELLQIIEDWVK